MIIYKRSNRYKYDGKYHGILIVPYTRCTRKISMSTYKKLNVVVCRRYFFLLRELFPELLVTTAMKFWAAVLSQNFQNLFNLRRLYQDHIQRRMWGLFKHLWRKYSVHYRPFFFFFSKTLIHHSLTHSLFTFFNIHYTKMIRWGRRYLKLQLWTKYLRKPSRHRRSFQSL